ncbi:MAG: MFS transporter [Syntrophobacteria bacterium]
MARWKQNLAAVWVSQFLSIMGFFFAIPFGPYYIQELGVHDPGEIKLWVSLFGAAVPLGLAIFSPIWGAIADRYGRRLMLLRANLGAAVTLGLMGTVQSVEALIGLRLLQGVLAGTVVAAQAMVSANTPENRSGLALGALSAAVYSGIMAGTFVGGIFAEYFGYRNAFFASSCLLLLAGLLVLFGTTEYFIRPEPRAAAGNHWFKGASFESRRAWPLLLLLAAMAFTRHFEIVFFPLLVQDIHGALKGAAFWTGTLSAAAGLAGFLAGIVFGRLADRFAPAKIAQVSALGAALLMVPHGLAREFLLLFGARFGMIFCAGGLDPLFQVWLAKVTPAERRGSVFGWAGTARSLGWFAAPLISGLVASAFGIRSIYFIGAVFYVGLIPLVTYVVRKIEGSATL